MPPLTRLILQIYIPCFLVIMAGFSSAESARPSPIWSLDFSPDGKLLAVGIYQNVVLLDAQKWEHKDTLTGLMDGVRDLCFSENGKRLAKRDDSKSIQKYRLEGFNPSDVRAIVGF